MPSLVGDYVLSKGNWYTVTEPGQGVDNLARWKLAHAGNPIGTRSYNFQLTSPTTFVPTDDSTNQVTAHNAGVAGSRAVTGGYDFLWKGNYVSTIYQVKDINGIPIPNGRLYYAGDTTNFDTPALTPPTRSPAIVRDWAEVTSTADLDTLIPLVNGNSYTLNYEDVSASGFGLTRYARGSAAADNNTAVTTPVFTAAAGDYISVGVGLKTTSGTVTAITWNGNALSVENADSRSLGGGVTLYGRLYGYIVGAGATAGVSITWDANVTSYAVTVVVVSGLSVGGEGNALGTNGTTTNMTGSFANGTVPPAYIHSCAIVAKPFSESHGSPSTGDATTEGQTDGTSNIWIAEAYSFKNTSPASWSWARNGVPTPTNWVFCRDQAD
jgi:hypothetical protein